MPLISGGEGDVTKVFMTDVWLIDRYVGSTQWMWGRNYQGGLGDNTTTSRSSPVQTFGSNTTWKKIVCGQYHTLCLRSDDSMYVFGYNNYGQLGTQNRTNYSSPVTTNPSGLVYWDIAAGFYHSGVIKTDGSLWMWGYNADGELGCNDATNRSSMIQTIGGGSDWVSINCGHYHTAGIKGDGSLWMWGYNNAGQLGDNTRTNRSSPVQTVSTTKSWVMVAGGGYHTGAVKNDGSLWMWGQNSEGQLGDNTTSARSSPVQTVSAGTSWKIVACGANHSGGIKLDGTLWMWGLNDHGQLGDNSVTQRNSPVQTVSAGNNWKYLACGYRHTAAVKTDGSIWCWGLNDFGQLGDNGVTKKSSPVQTVAGGTAWKQVSCGYTRTGAVKNG